MIMNDKDSILKQYTLNGIIASFAMAALFHFIYEWTHSHLLVGLLTPVNNSLWEYLKLLFIPMTLYFIAEYQIIGEKYPNLLPARVYGMAAGLAAMLLCYCTYSGILGGRYLILDIVFLIVGTALAFISSYWIQLKRRLSPDICKRSMVLLGFLIVCFIGFTLFQPNLGLFSAYKGIPKS